MYPARRPNRLPYYDYSQVGYYFITICTKHKEQLFGKVVGADVLIGPRVVLSPYGEAVETVIVQIPEIEKYVIMPNHVHLIIHLGSSADGPMGTSAPTHNISQIVRYLKRAVTTACGETVWQRSFHDHIIRNEADYLRIWSYIDTNPNKWTEDCYYEV